MKVFKSILSSIITLLNILFFSCGENDENNFPIDNTSEKTIENVSYGNDVKQKFDLYLPANRNSNTKTLILIHGGGWTEGDKADMNFIIPAIKQFLPNYAIANINYRLATSNQPAFPMQLDDIASVISKLETGNYNISSQFGFIGTSAGGHLSMQYSYTRNNSNKIKMAYNIVGPSNFTDPNYTNDSTWTNLLFNVTGMTYNSQNISYFEGLSPFHRATSTSVPTIAFYGNSDPLIPISQGIGLRNKLNNLNVYNEYYLYNGGHGTWSQSDYFDMFAKIKAFVETKF